MTRLQALQTGDATGKTKEMFDGIQSKLGTVPNMMKTMGNAPAVLEAYLSLSGALASGSLGGKMGELLALTVAETNQCNYCLSAHNFIGKNMLKLPQEEIDQARKALNNNPKIQAGLQFAKQLTEQRGHINDKDVTQLKEAGYTEGEIGEIVAHVALNVFTNYFNNTANTTIDFPVVEAQ